MSELPPQPDPSPDSAGGDPDSPGGEEAVQPFVITLPDDPASGADWYLWAAVLALIALVAFWPAINGTFLWDDDQYVTQNRALHDASGLGQIWKIPPGTIQYYPLTFTALWIEHQFFGNTSSLGYRVVNLLLHAGSAILLWRILRRLAVPGAWVAAALWAVHPLQAESVCWISESKNVLSGILALASVLFYLEFAGIHEPSVGRRIWNLTADWQTYAISAGFFLLAMLAKTAVVGLPIVILTVLWWKRRLSGARILGTLPMLVVGIALSLLTSHLETDPHGQVGASGPGWDLSFVQRLLISGRDFWFYIGKLILPIHQSFIYPRVVPGTSDGLYWLMTAAAIGVLLVLLLAAGTLGRGPFAAFFSYSVMIFPALGFFNVYPFRFSFVADHFQYLAGIPLVVLAVGIVARIVAPLWEKAAASPAPGELSKKLAPVAVVVAMVIAVLGAASWIRADVFSEPTKLWEDVLQPGKNPQSWMAAYNLARSRQSDASANLDEAGRLLQGGDEDSSKDAAKEAKRLLDESDGLLKQVLDNPATPDDVRYKAYDQWAQNDVTRMRSPDSDASVLLPHAAEQLKLALKSPAAAGDPLPFYTLGIVYQLQAQDLQKQWQQASTQPSSQPSSQPSTQAIGSAAMVTVTTAPATTRPNTPQEQAFIEQYLKSRENFQKAAILAASSLDSPTVGPEAARVLPLAALQSGNIDWLLASVAHAHNDVNSETRYSQMAAVDYSEAVRHDPSNAETRYRLALALENLGDLDGAKQQLMIILRDLDHYNARAYNEIGRVILESRPTSMEEFRAAVESFKDALKLDPNLVGARKNLELAMRMLASTRPATRASTAPSATAPSTQR